MPVLPQNNPSPGPTGLTPWVAAGGLSCQPSPCAVMTAAQVASAATTIADNLSGNRFGLRALRLRPTTLAPGCGCGSTSGSVGPFAPMFGWWGGLWSWWAGCSCGRVNSVAVDQPVWSVTSVKVDGAVLDPAAWTLYGDNRLTRLDGGSFPCCQTVEHDPDSAFGTLELAVLVGSPPDDAAQLAVQEIACEIIRVFDDPASCRLPQHIQSLTRQQLAVSFTDPTTTLAAGFSGLPLTDLWLGSLDATPRRRAGRAVDLSRATTWRGP